MFAPRYNEDKMPLGVRPLQYHLEQLLQKEIHYAFFDWMRICDCELEYIENSVGHYKGIKGPFIGRLWHVEDVGANHTRLSLGYWKVSSGLQV